MLRLVSKRQALQPASLPSQHLFLVCNLGSYSRTNLLYTVLQAVKRLRRTEKGAQGAEVGHETGAERSGRRPVRACPLPVGTGRHRRPVRACRLPVGTGRRGLPVRLEILEGLLFVGGHDKDVLPIRPHARLDRFVIVSLVAFHELRLGLCLFSWVL